MAQFTVYSSSDASAPTLNGVTGTLINVLDACLVNGYGSKSGAGWTKEYSDTNKAAYRGGAGTRLYLKVDDSAPITGLHARVYGYETMTHIDSGTNGFPSVGQGIGNSGFLSVRKSKDYSATARDWLIFADSRTFYMFVATTDVVGVYYAWMFGDFYSYVNNDKYNCALSACKSDNSAASANYALGFLSTATPPFAPYPGIEFFARGYNGMVGSVNFIKTSLAPFMANNTCHGVVPFPNPVDGSIFLLPIYIWDGTTAPTTHVRGLMRGARAFAHPLASVASGQILSGVGDLAGRGFIVVKTILEPYAGATLLLMEISDTLDTN